MPATVAAARILPVLHRDEKTAVKSSNQSGGGNGDDPQPDAVLHPSRINTNVVNAEYAVRGKLYLAAQARQQSGKKVILTNVGNPQALGQKPITFPRQVLALVTYPELIPRAAQLGIPTDAAARAQKYLEAVGSTGAYQDSRGNALVRKEVAEFLGRRDGFEGVVDDVFLTDGASVGITLCMRIAIRSRSDGVMMPIPQYPLYSATVEVLGGTRVDYLLDERGDEWALSVPELERAYVAAERARVTPRVLVVINPGNPTGQCMSLDNLREVLRWCARRRVVLFADEVYQTNIYDEARRPFISFRKALGSLCADRDAAASQVEMFSFHTVSKGAFGECGRRGAYFEAINIHAGTKAEVYKLLSMNLSSNVDGQIYVGLMVNPPKMGEPSYELYEQETRGIISSLCRRAQMLTAAFNALEGVSCSAVEGAMYAFPQIELPSGAIDAAKRLGHTPDEYYCLELLDKTGICAVPGSGFGQRDGSFHFRTTILPPESMFEHIVAAFSKFHADFLRQHSPAHARM
eukprot:CAMPEP_0185847766 /NCGR_PEP_ID=MMETSP1354-20130828/2911_1 /TAXON_ID=708628 /ORGANISM="Erythrolobus madagascarensis, Strain CCMP3276" /LENGTH=518 /DNA_ID=CAMNT_0028548097 /DNA_START=98 /DNA_END=1654 /DNA_ORIENTATION=-